MNIYPLFKKIAFTLDAEKAHHLSIQTLAKFPGLSARCVENYSYKKNLSQTLKCGLTFPYPIALAAGLDKNAECINFFNKLAFGAIEVGTVTPLAQKGNDKPRLFRLKSDESLLNRMGFNNDGMETVYQNIVNSNKSSAPLGVNLGKNKITSEENAPQDYRVLYKKFAPVADYLVVNVSSPNTPGLRDLQKVDSLKKIFDALKEERINCHKPLFIKISPDMDLDDARDIVDLALEYKLAGIIATNTTIRPDIGLGGVSGRLIKDKAQIMRNYVLGLTKNTNLDVIGVGGVDSFEDLKDFWNHGGQVMQIYTSFIYQGPSVLNNIYSMIN